MKVFLNDKIIAEEEAKISIWDRGFLLGDGVFETVKWVDHRVEFWQEHWQRLQNSCSTTCIPLPYDSKQIHQVIADLVCLNKLDLASVRLTLSRGVSGPGLSVGKNITPTLLITTSPIPLGFVKMREQGISVVSYLKQGHSDHSDLGQVKATNYLINVMAKNFADSKGADEAIFVDAENKTLECTTANVFYEIGGVWATPPLSKGILPGTIRQKIISGLKDLEFEVIDRDLDRLEWSNLGEMFISSSVRGLVPVREIDGISLKIRGPFLLKAEEALELIKKNHNN